jgi:hypothetical protein
MSEKNEQRKDAGASEELSLDADAPLVDYEALRAMPLEEALRAIESGKVPVIVRPHLEP